MKNSSSGPKFAVSAILDVFRYSTVLRAIERGSREYSFLVIGSRTSQIIDSVVCWRNGSILAVSGTGIRSMSDSLIACHPRMEDPSKPNPWSKLSSVSSVMGQVVCCQRPGKSMKRRSTNWTFLVSASLRTSRGVMRVLLLPKGGVVSKFMLSGGPGRVKAGVGWWCGGVVELETPG